MDLTQLANLGEFIGGVAVLATLVYLAVQVRSNTRSTDFLVEQGVIAQFNQVNAQLVENREVANVFRRGNEDPGSLDPDERIQFDLLMQEYMNVHHMIFDLGSKGIISKRFLEATLQEIRMSRDLPGLQNAMRGRAFYYSPDFCALFGIEERSGHRLGETPL